MLPDSIVPIQTSVPVPVPVVADPTVGLSAEDEALAATFVEQYAELEVEEGNKKGDASEAAEAVDKVGSPPPVSVVVLFQGDSTRNHADSCDRFSSFSESIVFV